MSQEDLIVLIIYNSIKDPGLRKELFKIPAKERKRTRIRQEISKYNHLQAQLQADSCSKINYVKANNKEQNQFCSACGKETPGDSRQFCNTCFAKGPHNLRCSVKSCPYPYQNHKTQGHEIAFSKHPEGANWSVWRSRNRNWQPKAHSNNVTDQEEEYSSSCSDDSDDSASNSDNEPET